MAPTDGRTVDVKSSGEWLLLLLLIALVLVLTLSCGCIEVGLPPYTVP